MRFLIKISIIHFCPISPWKMMNGTQIEVEVLLLCFAILFITFLYCRPLIIVPTPPGKAEAARRSWYHITTQSRAGDNSIIIIVKYRNTIFSEYLSVDSRRKSGKRTIAVRQRWVTYIFPSRSLWIVLFKQIAGYIYIIYTYLILLQDNYIIQLVTWPCERTSQMNDVLYYNL